MSERVNHPSYYGGDVKYETIKLVVNWDFGFCVGNTLKYIMRAPNKDNYIEDMKKARWYLDYAIKTNEGRWRWLLRWWRKLSCAENLFVKEALVYWTIDGLRASAIEALYSYDLKVALAKLDIILVGR